MPRVARSQPVFIDLGDSDRDSTAVCTTKRRRPTVKASSGSRKNASPSSYDNLPPRRRSRRISSSRRDKANKDKLDTNTFELYMEGLWKHIGEDKRSAYTYFDSLWFYSYTSGGNKSKILKWIKAKKIHSRQYVFIPIVLWGHWSLLVLCNFNVENYLDTKLKPRMLLLDSLKATNPMRLQSVIKRFVVDILKTEEWDDSEEFVKQIRLEIPQVPQQTGDECGFYVLFFIYCFLQNEEVGENFSHMSKDVMFDPEEFEKFQKNIRSF